MKMLRSLSIIVLVTGLVAAGLACSSNNPAIPDGNDPYPGTITCRITCYSETQPELLNHVARYFRYYPNEPMPTLNPDTLIWAAEVSSRLDIDLAGICAVSIATPWYEHVRDSPLPPILFVESSPGDNFGGYYLAVDRNSMTIYNVDIRVPYIGGPNMWSVDRKVWEVAPEDIGWE